MVQKKKERREREGWGLVGVGVVCDSPARAPIGGGTGGVEVQEAEGHGVELSDGHDADGGGVRQEFGCGRHGRRGAAVGHEPRWVGALPPLRRRQEARLHVQRVVAGRPTSKQVSERVSEWVNE